MARFLTLYDANLNLGFTSSDFDPYIFISKYIFITMYVKDVLTPVSLH